MIVPSPLDEAAQAAIDAAQTSSDGELLAAFEDVKARFRKSGGSTKSARPSSPT